MEEKDWTVMAPFSIDRVTRHLHLHLHQPTYDIMDHPKKKDSPQMQKAKGSWKQFKGYVQEKWGDLTGDEIDEFEGKRERLEGYLQKQTGEKREAIQKKLDALAKKAGYTF